MEGDYTQDTLYQLLLRAASEQDSIEHTSRAMEGVPHGNTLRYHLDKFEDMEQDEFKHQSSPGKADCPSVCAKTSIASQ